MKQTAVAFEIKTHTARARETNQEAKILEVAADIELVAKDVVWRRRRQLGKLVEGSFDVSLVKWEQWRLVHHVCCKFSIFSLFTPLGFLYSRFFERTAGRIVDKSLLYTFCLMSMQLQNVTPIMLIFLSVKNLVLNWVRNYSLDCFQVES